MNPFPFPVIGTDLTHPADASRGHEKRSRLAAAGNQTASVPVDHVVIPADFGDSGATTMDDQETVIAAVREARRILGRNIGSSPQDRETTINGLRSVLDDDELVRALERISQRSRPMSSTVDESPWS